MATYVLVHGAWDGGWAWRPIVRELEAAGHEAFAPTLTGHGERVHLSSPQVGLDTHVQDIVNMMRYELLEDVILVGISYGGTVTAGVAEVVPERISHMVYLDALVPEDGQSVADLLGTEVMSGFEERARDQGDGWRLPFPVPDADRRTDFPLRAFQQPLAVSNPDAARLKYTYVRFGPQPAGSWIAPITERIAARGRAAGWAVTERAFGHAAYFSNAQELAELLLELA